MIKPNNIYLGDATVLIDSLEDNSIDLTLTSPPYDGLRTYGGYCFDFENLAKSLYNKTKVGGIVVWNVGDAVENGSETLTSFKQAIFFKEECGFNVHDTMIWQKSNFSNPSSNRYHQVFEYVFILSKGKPKTFNPIKDRPNVCAGKIGSYGGNTVTQPDGSKKIRARKINTEFGKRHNVWLTKTAGQDQTAKRYKHPAMFSEDFANDHILSWSNAGDLVFDPFLGSGTTAAMAIKNNRKWLGFESNLEYFKIACDRIKYLPKT